MKHHYADLLDRDGAYWTVVPNIERYAYMIGKTSEGSPDVRIATLGKDDKDWKKVFTFPNLEELTLHEPSKAQLEAQWELPKLARLRITHARPKTLEFLGSLSGVEELVLEYVSGFSDLSPLRSLTRLRSLHLENLRRVRAFDGLSGLRSLTFLRIDGTLDWNQPIADFEFLRGLPALEVLSFGSVISPAPFPALLPALSLKNLKQLHGRTNLFAAAEYALLEVGLKGVDGTSWGPMKREADAYIPLSRYDPRANLSDEELRAKHPEVVIYWNGERHVGDPKREWFQFTGKGSGRVKCTSPQAGEKCKEFAAKYDQLKQEAARIVSQGGG